MRIAIVGGGISGCYLAILIKELHPNYDVTIFEQNSKLNKKIYATGNGKCNFANSGKYLNKYNSEFANKYIEKYGYKEVKSFYDRVGIPSILEGENAYPISKSAITVGMMIEKKINELNINIKLDSKVIDYKVNSNSIEIILSNTKESFDKLVFATGGKSSPQLGSDGNLYSCLAKHNYQITELSPVLCPVKVKENTKLIDGVRNNVTLSIYEGNNLIHNEDGELLFKDKGLSGIVTFNASHYINLTSKKNIKLVCDFVNSISQDILPEDYIKYVHPKLANYLVNNNQNIHKTVFSFKDFYDYSIAHVTHGGIELSQIKDSLESKIENNVYFVGELLDIDGVCGGFNMMWAFASAMTVAKEI